MADIAQKALDITKELIHALYERGDCSIWFDHLAKDCVFVCNGMPTLFSKDAVKSHFQPFRNQKSKILTEDYNTVLLGNAAVQIFAEIIHKAAEQPILARSSLSLTFKRTSGDPMIVSQHLFYDFKQITDNGIPKSDTIDYNVLKYFQQLGINDSGDRLTIKSRSKTFYVEPDTVIYIGSHRNKTELYCLDRIISCNLSFTQITGIVPDTFYHLRRGILINKKYITNLRRYEIELISGIRIPVPERTYTQVKKDLT